METLEGELSNVGKKRVMAKLLTLGIDILLIHKDFQDRFIIAVH